MFKRKQSFLLTHHIVIVLLASVLGVWSISDISHILGEDGSLPVPHTRGTDEDPLIVLLELVRHSS